MTGSVFERTETSDVLRTVRDRSFVHSVAWTGAVKWTGQLLTWVSTLVVARLLSPDDYGLVGMATIYLGLVTLLSEFGLGITIITLRDLTREQLSELNSIAVLVGVLCFVVSCAAAAPLGWFFRAPELPAVVIVLSTGFLISAFRTVPSALLQRDLQFRTEALLEGARGVTTAGAMVVLAYRGFGYWTLVVGSLLGTLLITVGTLCVRRHPFRWPVAASVSRAMIFTRHQLFGSFAWYTYSSADFFIAGRLLGKADLGVYSIAKILALTFPEKVTGLIMRVTPAYFSAVQNDHVELRRYVLRLTELLSLLSFPAMVGIVLVADELVAVALGDKWLAAVLPLKLLAIFAAYDSVCQLLGRALTAVGDVRFLMRVGVTLAIVMPAGFYVGSEWGVPGIAATWLILHPVSQAVILWRVRARIGVSIRSYMSALVPAVQTTGVMVVAVLLTERLMPASLLPAVLLACKVAIGALAYVIALVLICPAKLSLARGWIATLRSAAQPVAPSAAERVH